MDDSIKNKLLNDNTLVEFYAVKERNQTEEILWLFSELSKKVYDLERTINWLSIATSLSLLLAFLLIGHIAHYI